MNIRIQETINKLYQIEEDFIKWLKEAYDNEEFYIYLDFQRRLAKMQFSWCYNNSLKGDKNAIYSQINSIKSTLLFSERIAEMISEDLKFQIIMDLAYLYHSVEEMKSRDEYLDKAMELATKLEHQGFQNEIRLAEYHFTNSAPTIPYLLDLKETPASPNEITDQQEENMLKFLLKISGIDITADDDLAKLARIGLKDRNPERILRHCKHLHTEIINYGPIWDAVALPSTGTKIIFCEMNQTAIIGRELDNLLDNFIESNCKTCDFHAPRENVWKWTREWHRGREKPEKMKKLIENYFKY